MAGAGERGDVGKPGWGGGLTKMTHFKIRAVLWIVAGVLVWNSGAQRPAIIAVQLFWGGLLALSHPWAMAENLRPDPRLISCQVAGAGVCGAFLLVSLSAGVPKFGPYTDRIARSVVDIPDPNVNVQNPFGQSPIATPTTAASTLPAIPGQ